MKTPFYIIKRTPVNKETALAKWHDLYGRNSVLYNDASDLIDFCLSGGTEEKAYIEPGMRVRIKSMPAGAFDYNIPGVGVECELTELTVSRSGASFSINADDDYNRLRVKGDNLDLSEYLELV